MDSPQCGQSRRSSLPQKSSSSSSSGRQSDFQSWGMASFALLFRLEPSKAAGGVRLLAAGLIDDHECRRTRGVFDELQPFLGAEDADGGGDAVGVDAAGGDDADAAAAGDAVAGVWVDDVGVALAVHDQMLAGIAGGGDGGILEPDESLRRLVGIERGKAD